MSVVADVVALVYFVSNTCLRTSRSRCTCKRWNLLSGRETTVLANTCGIVSACSRSQLAHGAVPKQTRYRHGSSSLFYPQFTVTSGAISIDGWSHRRISPTLESKWKLNLSLWASISWQLRALEAQQKFPTLALQRSGHVFQA